MPKYEVLNKPFEGREPGKTFTSQETDQIKRAVARGSLKEVRQEKKRDADE